MSAAKDQEQAAIASNAFVQRDVIRCRKNREWLRGVSALKQKGKDIVWNPFEKTFAVKTDLRKTRAAFGHSEDRDSAGGIIMAGKKTRVK